MWLNKTGLPCTYIEVSRAGPRGQYGGKEGSQGQRTGNSKTEDSRARYEGQQGRRKELVGQSTGVRRTENRSQ